MTDAEVAELAAVLQECTARAENTQQQATALLVRLQNNELPTGDGVSFLEVSDLQLSLSAAGNLTSSCFFGIHPLPCSAA